MPTFLGIQRICLEACKDSSFQSKPTNFHYFLFVLFSYKGTLSTICFLSMVTGSISEHLLEYVYLDKHTFCLTKPKCTRPFSFAWIFSGFSFLGLVVIFTTFNPRLYYIRYSITFHNCDFAQ